MLKKLLVAALVLGGGFFLYLVAVWPPPLWYRTHWPKRTAFMTMRERQERPVRAYTPVPLERMARALPEAVLIGEDQRFWRHGGVDFVEMRAALGYRRASFSWSSVRDRAELARAAGRAWSKRDAVRGASTITQQLAKNLYLSPSRNPLRKLKEAVTAWRLERALGKRRILELYLNVAEFGDGIWGAEAASRAYFDRPAARLTREQAAALAATLPFPLRSNPGLRPARMRRRQALILGRMRGEAVEVPAIAEETAPPPPESLAVDGADTTRIQLTPGVDSLLDSLRAPVETLPSDTASNR